MGVRLISYPSFIVVLWIYLFQSDYITVSFLSDSPLCLTIRDKAYFLVCFCPFFENHILHKGNLSMKGLIFLVRTDK